MVHRFYRAASRVVALNSLLRQSERKVLINTFHKARSNSTAAWPPPKLLQRYKVFQVDNDLPVHIKSGFQDKFLFNSTAVLVAIGMLDGLYTLLSMAFPKKKN